MSSFQLKAGLTPIMSLIIKSEDISQLGQDLRSRAKQAPAMFENTPCVLDYSALDESAILPNPEQIMAICKLVGLSPIGVRGLPEDLSRTAQTLGLADFGQSQVSAPKTSPETTAETTPAPEPEPAPKAAEPTPAPAIEKPAATVHNFPVRSGQQLHAAGDLIIYGLVSAGAEVLAGGSITVFGPLRGRALAGIQGDTSATISCQSLEAELVAVAGEYKLFDDEQPDSKPSVVQLQDGSLNILTT